MTRQGRSPSRSSAAALAAAALLVAGPAGADELSRAMLERAAQLLEEASQARIPPLRPPTPVTVTWKAKKLGAADLGAPLIALAAGDLDGDGRAEVIAVTERDVVVLAPQGRRALAEIARAALPDVAASRRPRDAVATAIVVQEARGAVLVVRASTVGAGARYVLDDGALRGADDTDVYRLCEDRRGGLAAGRDYFERTEADGLPDAWPARFYAAACRDDLVDTIGRAVRVDAVLGAGGALAVTATVRCPKTGDGSADCVAERGFALTKVGLAFAIADADRDGRPELITSAASAPGDADKVTVRSLPATGTKLAKKAVFEKTFTGGVGGLVADDVDGDGDIEVIAAVRLPGADRVDLWLLN